MEEMLKSLGVPWPELWKFWLTGGAVALAAGLWKAYVYFRDRRTTVKPLDRAFPERDFRDRLGDFRADLLRDLDRIDSDTNWQHAWYVPLEAEVEVQRGRARRRVLNLSRAIRKNLKSQLILIVGDAGSGKSVALREFCREKLSGLGRQDKIPIYVNLREWSVDRSWSRDDPPTEAELKSFVQENLASRLSGLSRGFLDTYFDRLLDYGRFLIVFDSFDEIPSVMDAGEAGWLIEELSNVLERFLVGAKNRQAIVASREFRRPRFGVSGLCELTIRPFAEYKIAEAIQRASDDDQRFNVKRVQRALFEERPHLVPVARNPFILGLMLDYAEHRHGDLPNTQAELYESFIVRRLRETRARIPENAVSDEDVMGCASAMAFEMFQSEHSGLEIPLADLQGKLPDLPVIDVAEFLFDARMARRSSSTGAFGFVHRRFHEYFLVESLGPSLSEEHLESIPTDGRWREALALFAEVADEAVAKRIADHCLAEIPTEGALSGLGVGTRAYRRALHSLRFLADAFRGRRESFAYAEGRLATLMTATISMTEQDEIGAKHVVEAVGILSDENAGSVITNALATGNHWVIETAFRACRYLPEIPQRAKICLVQYVLGQAPENFLRSYKEQKFITTIIQDISFINSLIAVKKIYIILGILICAMIGFLFPIFLLFFSLVLLLKNRQLLGKVFHETRIDIVYIIYFTLFLSIMIVSMFSEIKQLFYIYSLPEYLQSGINAIDIIIGKHAEILSANIYKYFYYEYPEKMLDAIYIVMIVIFASILSACYISYFAIFIYTGNHYIVYDYILSSINKLIKLVKKFPKKKIIFFLILLLIIMYSYLKTEIFAINTSMCSDIEQNNSCIYYDFFLDTIALLLPFAILIYLLIVYVFKPLFEILFTVARSWRTYRRNKGRLETAKETFRGTRQEIAEAFLSFDDASFRLRYVRWLEGQTQRYLDVLKSEANQWPGGQRPYVIGEESSSLLARLDERWMGLNR